jgi:hypothetical protein
MIKELKELIDNAMKHVFLSLSPPPTPHPRLGILRVALQLCIKFQKLTKMSWAK